MQRIPLDGEYFFFKPLLQSSQKASAEEVKNYSAIQN